MIDEWCLVAWKRNNFILRILKKFLKYKLRKQYSHSEMFKYNE
jgi:hypothetical protein